MAEPECIGAAIRELMSRAAPPNSISPIRVAHAQVVADLAANPRHPIRGDARSEDLAARAEHLVKVFAALHLYLAAVFADTAPNLPPGCLDPRYLDKLSDLALDTIGVIRLAANDLREHKNGRAS